MPFLRISFRKGVPLLMALSLAVACCEYASRRLNPLLVQRSALFYYHQYMQSLVEVDVQLVWRGQPGARAIVLNTLSESIQYNLNSLGWRDEEFQVVSASSQGLVLGDSFAFGLGVPQERTFASLLTKALPGWKFWNQGVMGYAPDQYFLLAKRWLPQQKWNLLVLQLANNDLADIARHRWQVEESGRYPAKISPARDYFFTGGQFAFWDLLELQRVRIRESQFSEADLRTALSRLEETLWETLDLARGVGVPVVLLQASDWGEALYGAELAAAYRKAVAGLAQEYSVVLLEPHSQLAPVDFLPYPDLHWSSAGHTKVASELLSVLKKRIPNQGIRSSK